MIDETVYIDAYLNFINNTIHYSRYKIITNKYCDVKYKSKYIINLQIITDNFGIPIGLSFMKGSDSEVGEMIYVLKTLK